MTPTTLDSYVRSRRDDVDRVLATLLPDRQTCPAIIIDAMRYSVDAGGKRFRPVLTLAAADAVSGHDPRARDAAMPAACAIELIHTYSLIHDDLPAMDNDTLRRGKPTLHVVYGDGMAILAGDGLHAEAFALLARAPESTGDPILAARKLDVLQRIADAAGPVGMVGGQAIDLAAAGHAHEQSLTADQLRDMHARKTGALIRVSAVAGAIMAGGTPAQVSALDTYATGLGLAFQITDDILDVEGSAQGLGKTAGKDAAADKPTYPRLFGLDMSRQLARDAAAAARTALADASIDPTYLAALADWVVSRSA